MILASTVYETLIDILRADKRGLQLSPTEYSRMARLVNERVYSRFYKDFESNIDNIDVMGGFKVINHEIALASGVGSLPSNYYQLIGKPRTVDSGSVTRRVDLVSSLEMDDRLDDYLTQPTTTYPCASLGGEDGSGNKQIRLQPTTITTLWIDYLKTPDVPFLDYYTSDSTLVNTFMSEGATVSVPAGSTYRDGTAGGGAGIVSQTVNWQWSDSELPLIVSMYCQLIGIAIPDPLLIEAGNLDEQKN
jgi:hypothetical protein